MPDFSNSLLYRQYVEFPRETKSDVLPSYLIWMSVIAIYLVSNLPVDTVQDAFVKILQNQYLNSAVNVFLSTSTDQQIVNNLPEANTEIIINLSGKIIEHFVIPLKGLIFLIALILLGYPIIASITGVSSFWKLETVRRRGILSLGLSLFLAILIFPYRFPFGLGGMGVGYGAMSVAPFSEPYGWLHRRLLKPALAHYLNLDGLILYYVFSMVLTFILIYLTICFIEIKGLNGDFSEEQYQVKQDVSLKNKWYLRIYYASILTSSYIMLNYQWPGHTEQLAFILILIAACIPLTPQGRLSVVALSMATHEGNLFSLTPIILFCFPKHEQAKNLLLIPLWIIIWLLTRGFDLTGALRGHNADGAFQALLDNSSAALGGTFFAYKLLWLILVYVLYILWNQNEKKVSLAIAATVLTPLAMVLTIDVSRNVAYGFLGILMALSILLWEKDRFASRRWLSVLILGNLICPSFLLYTNTPLVTFPGLYKIFCLSCRMD